jgi:hypothetical protein
LQFFLASQLLRIYYTAKPCRIDHLFVDAANADGLHAPGAHARRYVSLYVTFYRTDPHFVTAKVAIPDAVRDWRFREGNTAALAIIVFFLWQR